MKNNTFFKLILQIFISAMLTSCGGSDIFDMSCNNEKDDIRGKMGSPKRTTVYNSANYSSETWWYTNIAYTFTYYKKCEVSTYSF